MKYVAIGIDFGATKIKGGIVDINGKILKFTQIKTEAEKGKIQIIPKIKNIISKLIKEALGKNLNVTGIGIGFPSPIDRKKNEILNPPNLPGWKKVPIKKILEEAFQIPVFLDNDADCALLGEKWLGTAKDFNSVLLLTFGAGVGGAVFRNGQLYLGENGHGAELGHIIIHPQGLKCGCGKRGCLEAYVSGTALKKIVHRENLKVKEAKDVFILYRQNNPKARKIIREYIINLILGLNILINKFKPDLIIFAGGIMASSDIILPIVKSKLKKNKNHQNIILAKAKLGNKAGIFGAAKLVFQKQ